MSSPVAEGGSIVHEAQVLGVLGEHGGEHALDNLAKLEQVRRPSKTGPAAGRSLPAGIFWPGAWSGRSSWCTSSRGSRCPPRRAHVESFHGQLREECLNASWFGNLFEARRKIGAWRREYNEERPHSSLGYRTPEEFAAAYAATALAAGPAAVPIARQTPEPLRRVTGRGRRMIPCAEPEGRSSRDRLAGQPVEVVVPVADSVWR